MEIEGIPFLYGSPREEMYDDTLIIYADLIASSYFLMTRYEEIQKRSVRDAFGRFPGKESLPYKAGFINRPIIEEYGKLLRERLRRVNVPIMEPNPGLDKIWLTHDIDAPFFCRTFRNLLREIVKRQNIFKAIKYYTGPLENDPYYTFPWMLQENEKVKAICGERCETVFSLKQEARLLMTNPTISIGKRCQANACFNEPTSLPFRTPHQFRGKRTTFLDFPGKEHIESCVEFGKYHDEPASFPQPQRTGRL